MKPIIEFSILTLSNIRPMSVVPCKYLSIHFKASQCCLPGHAMYQLTTLTACEISGRVHTIAYMMLPTVLKYGTLDMCSASSSLLGDNSTDNLKRAAKGIITGLDSLMLNCWRTFS